MRFVDHLIHHFIPHRHNNHKAHALQSPMLFFYLLLFVFIQFASPFLLQTRGNVLGYATNIEEQNLLEYTNEKRLNNGLPALKINDKLASAAREKAKYMFANNLWAHNGPDGTTPWKFISDAGYDYLFAGENLAKDFENSEDVVEAWMASPSHRANILQEKYQEVGFAVLDGNLKGEETTLIVQMFGAQISAAVPEVSGVNESKIPIIETKSAGESAFVTGAAISKFIFAKDFSLFFIGFLIILLVVDGLFIWRKKIIRISSHTGAHIMILACLFVFVAVLKSGRIL